MTSLWTGSSELVILKCWCGMSHAVPSELRAEQLRKFNAKQHPLSIYCPLGHGHHPAAESDVVRLERCLASEVARHDQTRAELRETENRRRAEKAAKSRLKNRIAVGVCPCCHRTFRQLARHMATKHPDYAMAET